jgi:anti-sigma B factor antagonist
MDDESRSEQPAVDARGIRPPGVFAIEEREAPPGVAVLTLTGEFDMSAAPVLREELALARTAGKRGVVLDMAEVTFVDSSALRELLRADAALRADDVPFVLAALRPPVDRLLELTRTAGMLTAEPTVDAALLRLSRT